EAIRWVGCSNELDAAYAADGAEVHCQPLWGSIGWATGATLGIALADRSRRTVLFTGDVIARLLPEYLDQGAFSVVLGARAETTALLEQQWDHIFFTGGTAVARVVMAAAAKNL